MVFHPFLILIGYVLPCFCEISKSNFNELEEKKKVEVKVKVEEKIKKG
jgi:hypothetical protein